MSFIKTKIYSVIDVVLHFFGISVPHSKADRIALVQDMLDLHAIYIKGLPGGQKAIFEDMDMREIHLKSGNLTGVEFHNCDLSDIFLSELMLHNVKFINCNLSGAKFMMSAGYGMEFSSCNMKRTIFQRTRISKALLLDNFMLQGIINQAYFYSTTVDQCDLSELKADGASAFIGCTFSDCETENSEIARATFTGCTVNHHIN